MNTKISIIVFLLTLSSNIFSKSILAEPQTDSNSICLVNTNTSTIIYSKNINEKVFPASTTKILTALIVAEKLNFSDIATVKQETLNLLPPYSSHVGLKATESLTIKDLLYCLLLSSGNDAALVLAEAACGNVEQFVNEMNTKAISLGCTSSHFINPHGYHDDNHYTSAYDMYLIMNEFVKNKDLLNIVKTSNYTTDATSINEPRILKNTNKLLDTYPYMIGGKTGYTEEAGRTFVGFASDSIDSYIITVYNNLYTTNTNSKFDESKKLFEYAFNNFKTKTILKRNSKFHSVLDYNSLNKKDLYINNNLQMTIPISHDNIIAIKYDKLFENEVQVNCKINGLSTKLVKIIECNSTVSTEILKKHSNILNKFKKNFIYNFNKIKTILHM